MGTYLESAWEQYLGLAAGAERELETHPGRYPHYSDMTGRWHRLPVHQISRWVDEQFYDHGNWTAGFSAGVSWLRRLGTRPTAPTHEVSALLCGLTSRATDATTHDLGFLFYPAFVMGSVAGVLSATDLRPAFTAASTLAERFRESGKFIQAFGPGNDPRSAGTSTIDTMMNLPLLWWAGRQAGELEHFLAVAHDHARTSAHVFLRDDDSTFHLVRFDPVSGKPLHRGTFQGASEQSCWSRGQAWAIAGFAWAFAATGDDHLLEVAERSWRYFASRLPSDSVVPWDFGDDGADVPEDASASAVAAVGALILAQSHPSETERQAYVDAGTSLIEGLAASAVSDGTQDGILLRSCYSNPHGLGVRGATPWGDFYYGLALALATGRSTIENLLAGSR